MTLIGLLLMSAQSGHEIYVQVTSRGFIGTVIIGLLAGWIAGVISRGRGFGCLVDILLGLVGAFIGRWIFMRLGIEIWGFFGTLAAATVGAVVLVAVARLVAGGHD
jgi:uncharacterized membrane protein YeaQ/YmgE (transglycosylase-associated protein family)